jgi:hypothetical protein
MLDRSVSLAPLLSPSLSTETHAILFGYRPSDFKEPPMEWTTPQHEEIDLNCEISSYANAEL